MGGDRRLNNQVPAYHQGIVAQLLATLGFKGRSFGTFALLAVLLFGGYLFYQNALKAEGPPPADNAVSITLNANGNLYLGSIRLNAEVTKGSTSYRYRYQAINHPSELIDQVIIDVTLPKAGTEDTVGHRFVNNGGASSVDSQLVSPTLIRYTATEVSPQSQLALELEVPQAFIERSLLLAVREKVSQLPIALWAGISIALPALAALLLLLVALGRLRKIPAAATDFNDPPSRLSPAIVGILLKGRLTNRELAATFIDLARRGHLVIRQVSTDDFRFRRLTGGDQLADYEAALLDQIFGPTGDQAGSEEISFSLAQEVFSKRVSESFILAYRKISQLGYFYTNPLALHRRYQISGLILFVIGLLGFFANLLFFTSLQYGLLFWAGMLAAALLVIYFSRGLPVRTVYADREVAKWLAFRRFLTSHELINYAAHSQEKYLAYLPYAIVLEAEQEWTKRFYNLPFAQPGWYVAANISTIDDFANQIFPLFGYLSQALALTVQPAAQ